METKNGDLPWTSMTSFCFGESVLDQEIHDGDSQIN